MSSDTKERKSPVDRLSGNTIPTEILVKDHQPKDLLFKIYVPQQTGFCNLAISVSQQPIHGT